MHILVFNGGSSSLSYKVFSCEGERVGLVFKGKAYRVGVKGIEPSYIESTYQGATERETVAIKDHATAARLASMQIKKRGIPVDAVGHRFVHGGEYFKTSALLDEASLEKLKGCLPLAPLHNPLAYNIIMESMKVFCAVPHYVVIDSAFHSTLSPKAYTYALPSEIVERYKYRRYGFHGISYSYVCHRMPEILDIPREKLRMIVCHLGTGGASVMAVDGGCSLDTSMGSSPNSGLIMSTRSGDIDPMVILHLLESTSMTAKQVEELLNNKSGLRGISGFSSDITDIIAKLQDPQCGDRARLAFDMYIHRLKSYIGSYIGVLQARFDALVFTDDIGVGNALIRQRVCESLCWAGVAIDESKNAAVSPGGVCFIESASSRAKIVTIPTEEELMICLEGNRILTRGAHAALH